MSSKGVQTSVDGRNASVQTDPSLGTISTGVQVPELALTGVRLGTVQRLSEVAQQVGLSPDVDTLSSFVSSGGVSLQCSESCTIHDSSCSMANVVLSQWPPAC